MIEIAPPRIDRRTEQRNVGHLADDTLQSLEVACNITVLLSKGMTAVHYEVKSLAVIGHVVIYQFEVVYFLVSEFVEPLDGKFVDLLHICHYGHLLSSFKKLLSYRSNRSCRECTDKCSFRYFHSCDKTGIVQCVHRDFQAMLGNADIIPRDDICLVSRATIHP